MVEVRVKVRPRWPVRLPPGGADGVLRRRGGVRERLLHVDGARVVVRVAQPGTGLVVMGAWAEDRARAEAALDRMRRALGLDEDLREFHERFRWDPLIGASVRRRPWLRPFRRPVAFEALAWAVTEQLIEFERAAAIQRRIVRALGPACPSTGLRDVPSAAVIAGCAPAFLQACDLAAGRALALVRCAREVAAGRVDLDAGRGLERLAAIPGIGPWTLEITRLHGMGRYDAVPAGDLNLLKLVGRLRTGSPHARATEDEVREVFAPYGRWAGLAATHAMHAGPAGRLPLAA